jgi:hypothetical protein
VVSFNARPRPIARIIEFPVRIKQTRARTAARR